MATREHVHLIGIGGTGMAALAGLLHESGCRVTGSDRALYPPTSTLLEDMALDVRVGFDAANLNPAPDLIVVGNAVRRGNPEAEETLDRGLPYASMPQVLHDRFLARRHSIVVSGTHGKTTTTAMLAWVLHAAGRDPGFLVGGLPLDFDRPFRVGRGPAFVIEGDEYDSAFFDKGPKFMHYRPDTALIGTVEFDHADIYRDLEHVKTVFRWLTNLVPRRGLLVRHEDCAVTREVTSAALCRVEGYGERDGRWRATEVRPATGGGAAFRILRDGEPFGGEVTLVLGGDHNVRNALAVTAAAHEQGLSADEIVQGLSSFRGVRRRLEVRGEARGVVVLDDFAHHPTAIAGTIEAVRARYPGRRLWAVFEPRSWSMRRNVFQDRLPASFAGADEVLLARVYGAEELPAAERLDPERLVDDLAAGGTAARFHDDVAAIVGDLVARASPGDVVLVMSNGGFDGLQDRLLAALSDDGR
jgi:UDP-N-acetylmuramate: L-alanyl-gamma-D-glutamyl-meso-diaminopimelate ligase